MKAIKTVIFLFILAIIPISVYALDTISKLPPDVVINGIDKEKYNVEEEITEDKIVISIKEKDGELLYNWSFAKEDIKDNKIDLNFELSFTTDKQKEIDNLSKENDDKTYLSFTHHGILPSNATINVYVGNRYQDDQKLYLYYYNEEDKQIEYVANNLKVKNGYVKFNIDHCSVYFLTGAIVNNAKGNPKILNNIIIVLGLFIFVFTAIMLFSKK